MFDSVIRTFVLPRAATPVVTRTVFIVLRWCFNLDRTAARTYNGRDSVMSLFGPIGLLTLPAVWSVMVLVAYTAMFHALGVRGFERAFEMSGSSLFTLGFVRPPDLATNVLAFLEAATGLTVLGLLIAYLPTIYSSFSRREVQVAQLEVRAGNPPSGVHLLVQSQRMERFHLLDDFWVTWQLVVHRAGGDAHLARGAQLLPLTAGAPLVGHRERRGARRGIAAARRGRPALRPRSRDLRAGGVLRAARDRRLLRHPVRPRSAAR